MSRSYIPLYVLSVIMTLALNLATARGATMSSTTKATASVPAMTASGGSDIVTLWGMSNVFNSFPIDSLGSTPPSDASLTACLTYPSVRVTLEDASGAKSYYQLTGWNEFIIDWNADPGIVSLSTGGTTLTNSCDHDIVGYFTTILFRGDDDPPFYVKAANYGVTIPASTTCSATVNDLVLPQLTPGTTTSATMPINKTGASSVSITSNDLNSSGTLLLGNKDFLTVTPTSTSYIDSTSGAWTSGAALNDIPLLVTTGSAATAGTYKSDMTATLTCE